MVRLATDAVLALVVGLVVVMAAMVFDEVKAAGIRPAACQEECER